MPYVTGPAHLARSVTGAISAHPVSAPRCLAVILRILCFAWSVPQLACPMLCEHQPVHCSVCDLELHLLDSLTSSFLSTCAHSKGCWWGTWQASERKEAFVPMIIGCKVCIDLANSDDKCKRPVCPHVSHPSCLQRQSTLSVCVVAILVVVINNMAVNVEVSKGLVILECLSGFVVSIMHCAHSMTLSILDK